MKEEPGAHVYMLRRSDGSYYVGSARLGLERRVGEHNQGVYGGYTSTRRPVVLVWAEQFEAITDAIAFERQLKGWSRAKKEALIRGDFAVIQLLSKRKTPHAPA
ncbi:MAG: GIY-YIG nuclease family protein [Reyranella sp.]|uniref:GIY-YIG nuclease family protein n=1 Tax=Reyranella sp. TaxID=1929291 RepID=UPI001AC8447F|nr:GIY-YIG nuclease family protein [Reyranella sp.]MBN9085470.1 GIY-YIG nuclease family protein [Reyranella sp.]